MPQTHGESKWKEWRCKLQICSPLWSHPRLFAILIAICSKDVRLPVQLQRAMAAEAEAAREARAKVIAAEGEQRASRALKEAAQVISQSPSALQLRLVFVIRCLRDTLSIFRVSPLFDQIPAHAELDSR